MWISRSGPLALSSFHFVTLHPNSGTWRRPCCACDCSGAASSLLGQGLFFQPRDSTQSAWRTGPVGAHRADVGLSGCPQHIPGAILGPNFARVFHCCLSPGSVRGAGTGRALTQDPRGCEAMSGSRPSGLLPRAAAAGSGLPRLSSEPLADTRGWTVLIPLSFSRCLWTERSPARDIAISSPGQNDPSPGQNDPWPGHSDPGLKRSPGRKVPTFVGGKTKPRPLPAPCYESANSSCRVVTDISIIQWPTGERTPRQ